MSVQYSCPSCGSPKVWSASIDAWMLNGGEHLTRLVQKGDSYSRCGCMYCAWSGTLEDVTQSKGADNEDQP